MLDLDDVLKKTDDIVTTSVDNTPDDDKITELMAMFNEVDLVGTKEVGKRIKDYADIEDKSFLALHTFLKDADNETIIVISVLRYLLNYSGTKLCLSNVEFDNIITKGASIIIEAIG